MEVRPVLKQSTIYEEEVPVIVRRRGCLLRVQVTSIVEDTDGEWENSSHHLRNVCMFIRRCERVCVCVGLYVCMCALGCR